MGKLRHEAFFVVMLLFNRFSYSGPDLSSLQRKHTSGMEAWTLCCRVKTGLENQRYYALFFLTGKLLFLNGNYVHYSMLSLPAGTYQHESATVLPPFGKVKHDYTSLNEEMGGHRIRKENNRTTLSIFTSFKKLRQWFIVGPGGNFFSFSDVIGDNYEKRKFDWYILPRCSVTVVTEKGDTLFGSGHFQQFWGEEGGANCDWLVLHTDQGNDLTIARFPEEKKNISWLPGDYIFLSEADGSSRKITAYDIVKKALWTSAKTNRKYPLGYRIRAPQDSIDLSVTALKSDQTRKIAGKEYWYGFGKVTGTIGGRKQTGWGYLAPLGRQVRKQH
jgi:hypothetical protein